MVRRTLLAYIYGDTQVSNSSLLHDCLKLTMESLVELTMDRLKWNSFILCNINIYNLSYKTNILPTFGAILWNLIWRRFCKVTKLWFSAKMAIFGTFRAKYGQNEGLSKKDLSYLFDCNVKRQKIQIKYIEKNTYY